MKILGDPIFAKNPDGTLKSRIGTLFFRTPGLVTVRGVHAMQRIAVDSTRLGIPILFGYDAIHDLDIAAAGHRFFDRLTQEGKLAKTILYCLNPKDNAVMMTMAYTFNDGTVPGKMQFGSGWWFLDQEVGMRRQMDSLSNLGLISRFVGMLTDSRSFVSYPRHEYFRRILCDVFGKDVELGKLPASEMDFIGKMVEDICYNNAKNYFNF